MARPVSRPGAQRGISLLALAAVLIMASLWFVVSTVHTRLTPATAFRNHNAQVLQQAKQALIGYVVKEALNLNEPVPGRLPCPESAGAAGGSTEGTKEGACRNSDLVSARTIGRLPWKTLGMERLVDAMGEPLWYAVSPNWIRDTALPVVNSGSTGQLSVDGVGNVVAVLIAPGAPLVSKPTASQAALGCAPQGQARNDKAHGVPTVNLDYAQYLECENASPFDNRFVTSVLDNETNRVFNDQLVYITATEILNAIQGAVAERMQRTVAPLLHEASKSWPTAGNMVVNYMLAPSVSSNLGSFLPYAFAFVSPMDGVAREAHCGGVGTGTREGLLPVATRASPACPPTWDPAGFTVTQGIGDTSCTTPAGSTTTTCTVSFYSLTPVGIDIITNWLGYPYVPPPNVDLTVQGRVPLAAAGFHPLDPASDSVSFPDLTSVRNASFTAAMQPSGQADISLQLQLTSATGSLCDANLPIPRGIFTAVCKAVAWGLSTQHTVQIQFRPLADASVTGLELPPTIPHPASMSLVSPAAGDPHYWFMANEWYRYTYYAIAPSTSAAQTAGSFLTVGGFPDGTENNKRFALVMMGLPTSSAQADRGTGAPYSTDLAKYFEGENSDAGDNTFAYKVSLPGNDRVAACPYAGGLCNP